MGCVTSSQVGIADQPIIHMAKLPKKFQTTFKKFNISCLKSGEGLSESEVKKFVGNVKLVTIQNIEKSSTLSCIDGRQTNKVFACPGGDSSIWILGLTAVEELGKIQFSEEQLKELFQSYLKNYVKDKIYFHTDEGALKNLFKNDNTKELSYEEQLRILLKPTEEEKTVLLKNIKKYKFVGCGHIKNTLCKSNEYVSRKLLGKNYIIQFFQELWAGNSKVKFEVLRGVHQEKAVCVVVNKVDSKDQVVIQPLNNDLGMSAFVYHPQVEKYKRESFVDFLVLEATAILNISLTKEDIISKMNEIGEIQKNHTVEILAPKLPIYKIEFE